MLTSLQFVLVFRAQRIVLDGSSTTEISMFVGIFCIQSIKHEAIFLCPGMRQLLSANDAQTVWTVGSGCLSSFCRSTWPSLSPKSQVMSVMKVNGMCFTVCLVV